MGDYIIWRRHLNNKIYCSTGTIVGQKNNWNHRLFVDYGKYIEADGFEFMMVKAYYDKLSEVLRDALKSGLRFATLHIEKDVGIYLSCKEEGYFERAMSLFELNCKAAEELSAEKVILHLWSGQISDSLIENNLSCLDRLYEIADRSGVSLLIENVPCTKKTPFENLSLIAEGYPKARFVYDLRFGAFHEENEKFLSSGMLENGMIDHIHISDYVGPAHDFSSLRPILHLGEGIIGLDRLLPRIASVYHSTVTLESPEICSDRCAYEVINRDLEYIKSFFKS